MPTTTIIGCGDIGCRVGVRIIHSGEPPVGVVRSSASIVRLFRSGITPLQLDLDDPGSLHKVYLSNSVVYYFAPPPPNGNTDTRMQHFLDYCSYSPPNKIIYISTSGVYGDCKGEWVKEDRIPNPQTSRAKRRLYAEQLLQTFRESTGVDVVILRVGGIYGPGRLPIERIPAMKMVCPDEAPFSNRIHADDLSAICIAAAERGESGAVYNVADDAPTSMTDYIYSVADMAGIARPECVPLSQAQDNLSPGMLSFIRESRRMDTLKLKKDLGIILKYPTLLEGLPSCFQREDYTD